ncbi:(R,R)-butanediol dehydrogenase / meso-butanediol dehydrogenase / diacetyl reductase [Pseudomonas chlororaphis]|uniref:zinc-dependent alcohol dehydrogenase n=1 Tax=Pseudomonas chlororaphis TaxID=587753 RepID=UPI00087CDFB2|nr:alcohol dehydrogenase catalytic domain-containing protein [Pseudomonas chlororaphis]PWY51305.1 alcohol dehydrogenase [Pseudomonas sp. RW409]AZD67469.1 Alcohol dehydrogenase [Pseudomonas chlororaphis subsp. aurantiaca]QIT23445.1 alcohol dehydrogenase catalytic domain-containing protein [Pseudomonas chlororaphis subsp. aurantiaca]QTT82980.1 alcohol dehydrogenase catalytic domain-containing protein [Pseudomonas chlororaphis]WDH01533.1 alcohol dehydrogenase catalytic domain-containing protein [
MRAIRFYGKGDLRFEEVAEPAPPPAGFVRLAVRAAGICGSDLHNYQTGQWISQLPVTPGHEFCAEIIALGQDVEGFALGERVVVDSRAICGECDHCLDGAGNLCRQLGFVGEVCDGGFAEQSVQPAHRLLKVPAGVSDEIAALAEPLGVALRVVNRLAAAPGEPVLIAGGGTIGGLAALLLRELGEHPVLLVERNVARADLLREVVGVQPVAFNAEQVRKACDGREPRWCIEATGSPVVLEQLIANVASGGRIALVGLFHGAANLNINQLVEREIDLLGCSVFRDEQHQALELLPRLSAKLQALISEPISLEQGLGAYRDLPCGNAGALKTIIKP